MLPKLSLGWDFSALVSIRNSRDNPLLVAVDAGLCGGSERGCLSDENIEGVEERNDADFSHFGDVARSEVVG